jgi:hypothetical protein
MLLRSNNNFLGSSKAARRRNVRAERAKAFAGVVRGSRKTVGRLVSFVVGLLLLCGLPLLYLAASYLAIDLPLRWMQGREPATARTLLMFAVAIVVALTGLVRAIQGSPPVAPVRPRFARAMYALSWVTGLLFTLSDLSSR